MNTAGATTNIFYSYPSNQAHYLAYDGALILILIVLVMLLLVVSRTIVSSTQRYTERTARWTQRSASLVEGHLRRVPLHHGQELFEQVVKAGHLAGESRPIDAARTLSLFEEQIGQHDR